MERVYIIGTSPDINNLDKSFFEENDTIGINHSHVKTDELKTSLKYWICLDECMKFMNWMCGNAPKSTVKYVPSLYLGVDIFAQFYRECQRHGRKDVRIYKRLPFYGKFYVRNVRQMDGVMIDERTYTIFSAISLAIGLGYKEIVMRGVSYGGGYFDKEVANRPAYFNDIRKIMLIEVQPALDEIGVRLKNETE